MGLGAGNAGDTRTVFDVVVYLGFLAALATALVLPGTVTPALAAALPENTSGLVQTTPVIVAIALLVIVGVRDKTIAVASRIEQYLPALVFFSVLSFVDMIIALKLLIVAVWVCAGISKFGRHFVNVIPPMLSNTPFWPPRWLKRALYRDFPRDVRPSKLAHFMAHAMGTTVEIAVPLVLLFSPELLGHARGGRPHRGLPPLHLLDLPARRPAGVEHPVLLRRGVPLPRLPRAGGVRGHRLLERVAARRDRRGPAVLPRARQPPPRQGLVPAVDASVRGQLGVGAVDLHAGRSRSWMPSSGPRGTRSISSFSWLRPEIAEITMQQTLAWRSMHSQGRGLFSVLYRALPDIETRTIREGEFACNSVIGFNFGDGHLHDESLIRALQSRCHFAPGEFVVVWVESQAIHADFQEYKVIDAARASSSGEDGASRMPWRPAVARGRPHPARAVLALTPRARWPT